MKRSDGAIPQHPIEETLWVVPLFHQINVLEVSNEQQMNYCPGETTHHGSPASIHFQTEWDEEEEEKEDEE